MALYWLDFLDPDETKQYEVDWTEEMSASGDTVDNGTPPTFVDTVGDATTAGLTITGISVNAAGTKVAVTFANSDPGTNRAAFLASSPILIDHAITTTTNAEVLVRRLMLVVDEAGGSLTTTSASATADSLATLAEADTYCAGRGYTDWVGTEAERVFKIRRGMDAFIGRYQMRLKGAKSTAGQALPLPRVGLSDEDGNQVDGIPERAKYSQIELARIVNTQGSYSQPQALKRAKAGTVEVEFAGAFVTRTAAQTADEMMAPYLAASNRIVKAP